MKLPKMYKEDESFTMPSKFLSDEVYADAIAAFPIVTSDIILVDRASRTLLLPYRGVEPAHGPWVFGGRRRAGEDALTCAARCFERETSLAISKERFHFLGINEYLWPWRKEEPHETGMHNVHFAFMLEITPEELAQVTENLDPKEYDVSCGITPYTRDDLVAAGARKILVDYYDKIFGSE